MEYAASYFSDEIYDGFSIIVLPHVIPFSIVTPFLQSTRSTCSAQLRLLACLVHAVEFTTIVSNELKSQEIFAAGERDFGQTKASAKPEKTLLG